LSSSSLPSSRSLHFPYTTLFRSCTVAVIVLGILGCDIGIRWPTPPCHQVVLGRVDRDPVQPGVERAVSSEICQSTIGLDESFLGSEEHTSELQSRANLVCRPLLE